MLCRKSGGTFTATGLDALAWPANEQNATLPGSRGSKHTMAQSPHPSRTCGCTCLSSSAARANSSSGRRLRDRERGARGTLCRCWDGCRGRVAQRREECEGAQWQQQRWLEAALTGTHNLRSVAQCSCKSRHQAAYHHTISCNQYPTVRQAVPRHAMG